MGNICFRTSTTVDTHNLVVEEEIPHPTLVTVGVDASNTSISRIVSALADNEETAPLADNPAYEPMSKHMNFPFLVNRDVINWTTNNKVMMIMRGLPGSGKSTIVNHIKQLYSNCIVCSADDYFADSKGNYSFDKKRLKEAHNWCQNRAYNALNSKRTPVIIDNTNIKHWEMKYYFDIANKSCFSYKVLIFEPKTPWSKDAFELSSRCKHGITFEHIRMKMEQFQSELPKYYGFFIGDEAKSSLLKTVEEILRSLNDNGTSYVGAGLLGNVQNFHVTTKFYVKYNPADPYHSKTEVVESYGGVFDISICGVFVTRQSIGLRVRLSDYQLTLWDNDDRTGLGSTLPIGSKAHITVSTAAPNIPPKQCGFDLTNILLEFGDSQFDPHSSSFVMESKWGSVFRTKSEAYLVNFNEPLVLKCLFTGYYS